MCKKETALLTVGLLLFVTIASYFAGLEQAMDNEVQRQRFSVYCQQPRHVETLCHNIEE